MFQWRNNKPVTGRGKGALVVNDERVEVKRGERVRKEEEKQNWKGQNSREEWECEEELRSEMR